MVVGSGVSRELFEALVYAIASKNETLLDTLVDKGYDFDPIELSGPWSDVKSFLSDNNNKAELFANGSTLLAHVPFLGQELVDRMKISIDDATRIPGLIRGLSRILSDKEMKAVSPKLRKIAMENFDWEIRAQQMVAAYSKFISN